MKFLGLKRSLIASAVLAGAASAYAIKVFDGSPLVQVNDYTSIFFDGSIAAKHTNNFFADASDKRSVNFLEIAPGAELFIGKPDSKGELRLAYRHMWKRHSSAGKKADSSAPTIVGTGKYKWDRLDLSASAYYMHVDSPSADTNARGRLIKRRNIGGNVTAAYDISDKFDLVAGFKVAQVAYRKSIDKYNPTSNTSGFKGNTTYYVPVNLYYQATEKWQIGPSYQFSYSDIKYSKNTRGHLIGLGFRGELTEKLLAKVDAGYQHYKKNASSTAQGLSQGTLGGSVLVSWKPTEKIALSASLDRAFSPSATGASILKTGGNLGVNYELTEAIGLFGKAGFSRSSYRQASPRVDKTTTTSLGALYKWKYWTVSGDWRYSNNNSTVASSSFQQHMFGLTVALRY